MQGKSVISVIVSREVYTQGDEMKGCCEWRRLAAYGGGDQLR